MQLFILRHGHAEQQVTTDEARSLTHSGRKDVSITSARSMNDLKVVQEVWVSSLVRAQQTAKIVCDELTKNGVAFTVNTTELLVPEADPVALFDALQLAKSDSILLVSHQPLVGHVIDLLCCTYHGFHEMNTSSLACIDCKVAAPDLGKLRWLRHVHE